MSEHVWHADDLFSHWRSFGWLWLSFNNFRWTQRGWQTCRRVDRPRCSLAAVTDGQATAEHASLKLWRAEDKTERLWTSSTCPCPALSLKCVFSSTVAVRGQTLMRAAAVGVNNRVQLHCWYHTHTHTHTHKQSFGTDPNPVPELKSKTFHWFQDQTISVF